MKRGLRKTTRAFTRIELLACLCGAALLLTVIVPSLASTAARSDRVGCMNNLRQIGVGYSHFGLEDRLGRAPWRVPMGEGGNSDSVWKSNLAWQFSILSNWLESPKCLADPGDARFSKRIATNWSYDQNGGLLHPAFGNRAVSYWLGLRGDFRVPEQVLSGDRNLSTTHTSASCADIYPLNAVSASTTEWTNDVHGLSGNLLLFDGSVRSTDTTGARNLLSRGLLSGDGTLCSLFPF